MLTHIHYICHGANFFSSFPTKFIRFCCRYCLSCHVSLPNCISQAFLSAFELEIWRGSGFHWGELVSVCVYVSFVRLFCGQLFQTHMAGHGLHRLRFCRFCRFWVSSIFLLLSVCFKLDQQQSPGLRKSTAKKLKQNIWKSQQEK